MRKLDRDIYLFDSKGNSVLPTELARSDIFDPLPPNFRPLAGWRVQRLTRQVAFLLAAGSAACPHPPTCYSTG